MAWTGDIMRGIVSARLKDGAGSPILALDCGHEQPSNLFPDEAIKLRQVVCAACSRPYWNKISAIRSGISFDDVLSKLKNAKPGL